MQETLSIKVTPAEKMRLRRAAEARGVKMSTLLRQGLRLAVSPGAAGDAGSCYEQARAYFERPGSIGASGRGDLSTNKSHLRNFGRKGG